MKSHHSIKWLARELENRINSEVNELLFLYKIMSTEKDRRYIIKMAKRLEPVLYVIEIQYKDVAELIKNILITKDDDESK